MIVFALLTAGFWFLGETLVQLNLYRFSIYIKLLSCIGAAWLLWDRRPRARPYVVVGLIALGVGAGVVAAATGLLAPPTLRSPLGIKVAGLEGDDAGYRELAAWVRDNTPVDAIFLVPPDEESFRVHARRAIVVNFKGVPQLGGELPEWRDRLEKVLDLDKPGLLALPRPMGRTLRAIRARYASCRRSITSPSRAATGALRRAHAPASNRGRMPGSSSPIARAGTFCMICRQRSSRAAPDRAGTVRLRPHRVSVRPGASS